MRHMGYAIAAIVLLGAGGGVVLADYMYGGEAQAGSTQLAALDSGIDSVDADAEMARTYEMAAKGQVSSGTGTMPAARPRAAGDNSYRIIGVEQWSDEEGFDEAAKATGITGICGSGIIMQPNGRNGLVDLGVDEAVAAVSSCPKV